MGDAAEMAERHGRILAELSELSLELARDLQARALAADTPEQTAELAAAFHRVARSARQTVALEARLERDRRRAEREDAAYAARETETRVQRRKTQVKAAVGRLIWTEAEADEAERLEDELSDLLDEDALHDGFAAEPIATHIQRIQRELGLPPSAHPRAGGDPNGASAVRDDAGPAAAWIPASAGTSGGITVAAAQPWRSSA